MNAKYGQGTYEAFVKLKERIVEAANIGNLYQLYKHAVNVEKIKGHKDVGSFRLNLKVRIFFSYDEQKEWLSISEVVIIDVSNDNHEYK